MPAYKDKKTKKWNVSFYVKINGENIKVQKRGFLLKKEALDYERDYINSFESSTEITFQNLFNAYMNDQEKRLRLNTMETKKHVFRTKILPYFKDIKIKDIKALDIRNWQNDLMKKGYSETYLKTINNQIVALMNYAVKFYDLKKNPCSVAGTIGKKNADEMNVWTVEEFNRFIKSLEHKPVSFTGFNILFYTGLRIGELLGLCIEDIDFKHAKISVNKSYQRINRKDVITPPKTPKSKRIIDCPNILMEIIDSYINTMYKPSKKTRIFEGYTKRIFEHDIDTYSRKAGVKRIRVHDLRHSHATLLLSKNVNIVTLSRRLGHEKVSTTLDIYSHALKEDNNFLKNVLNEL